MKLRRRPTFDAEYEAGKIGGPSRRHWLHRHSSGGLHRANGLESLSKQVASRTVFKWIKQHLRINQDFGRLENAVKYQIWTAVVTYLLGPVARKRLESLLSLNSQSQVGPRKACRCQPNEMVMEFFGRYGGLAKSKEDLSISGICCFLFHENTGVSVAPISVSPFQ